MGAKAVNGWFVNSSFLVSETAVPETTTWLHSTAS